MATSPRIDLNADVGEGSDADEELIGLMTSVSVACGAHAGDADSMQRALEVAARHAIAVGAHPGYPDRDGFGRRDLDLSDGELRASLRDQLLVLAEAARSVGVEVRHVKPHGALYNRAASDARVARSIAEVVRETLGAVFLVGLAGSELVLQARAAGLPAVPEAFADRAYEPDGSLRSRTRQGSVHADPETVAQQAVGIARHGRIALDGGGVLAIEADTICLHGDSPGAVANALAVRAALSAVGVEIAPFHSSMSR